MLTLVFCAHTAAAQPSVILEEGDLSPDGSTYVSLRRAESGGAGRVAFNGRTVFARGGVFIASSAPGTAVSLIGEVLPGSGVTVRRVYRPAANVLGETAWQARVAGLFRGGIFSSLAGNDVVVARGDAVGMTTINGLERPAITDNGDVVFVVELATGDEVLFRCTGGDHNCHSITTAVRERLVGVSDVYFDSVHAENRVVCALNGQIDASNWGIAFHAETAKQVTGCTGSRQDSILRMAYGGPVQTVALVGDPAVPFDGTRYYERFSLPPTVNNSGNIAFFTETVGPVQEVIYFCDPAVCPATDPEPVVFQHDDDGGGRLVSRFRSVDISDANDISFQAVASDSNGKVLSVYIARDPGWTLERVAANKDPVGGGEFRRVGPPSMSSDGYVVFQAELRTPSGSNLALWAYQ